MIVEKIIHKCRNCESTNIVKNGTNKYGQQQYYCNDCGAYKILEPKVKYTEERKEEILRAYHERSSIRGISRQYGVARETLTKWLKKNNKPSRSQG